jgi:hypothetical protein
MDTPSFPDVSLPETSILDERDYRALFEAATDDYQYGVLQWLYDEGRTPLEGLHAELRTAADEPSVLDDALDTLQTTALVRHHVGPPSIGESYSISSLGEAMVEYGPEEGTRRLMKEETALLWTAQRD